VWQTIHENRAKYIQFEFQRMKLKKGLAFSELHDWDHPVPFLTGLDKPDRYELAGKPKGASHPGKPEDNEHPGRLIDHSGDLYAGMYKANTYHPSAHQDKKLSTQELSRTIFEMTHQDQGSLEQYRKAMSMFVRQLLAHVDSVRLPAPTMRACKD
jgi:hypothetical protein